MDNKYELGGSKVAAEYHEVHHRTPSVLHPVECRRCGSTHLVLCPSMHDHCCMDCGGWQSDVPQGYSAGRNSDY